MAVALLNTVGSAAAQVTASLPATSAPAAIVSEARPVQGWVRFCDRHPAECEVDLSEPARVALTPALWRLVLSVNQRVNATIRAVTDEEHWGVADRWDLASDGEGDCEDFQLLKRKQLAQAGLPRRAMRMTVVVDDRGEGHAVLMLRTDRGDFILDNKTSTIMPWHLTGYVFVKREGESGPAWISLGGATAASVTANR